MSSSDPKANPIIQPNFLHEKDDLNQLVKGGKLVYKLMNDKSLGKHIKSHSLPNDRSSDDSLIDHIKKTLETVYHPVGTCKMGNDSSSVVDSNLKVYGLYNLRVIDASIMTTIVSGNTNETEYMIAENEEEMILNNV